MKKIFLEKLWNWRFGGVAMGFIFLITIALVKPIGVSTQFVIVDGILWHSIDKNVVVKDSENKSGYASSNDYLNKSGGKYAKNVANPLNYGILFVLSMILGGFVAKKMQGNEASEENSSGEHTKSRNLFLVFIGAIFVLIGARMAGGCTSGHMVSGIMQSSLSGYIFIFFTFSVAVPLSIWMHKKEQK